MLKRRRSTRPIWPFARFGLAQGHKNMRLMVRGNFRNHAADYFEAVGGALDFFVPVSGVEREVVGDVPEEIKNVVA
jgi:hypothetical protein